MISQSPIENILWNEWKAAKDWFVILFFQNNRKRRIFSIFFGFLLKNKEIKEEIPAERMKKLGIVIHNRKRISRRSFNALEDFSEAFFVEFHVWDLNCYEWNFVHEILAVIVSIVVFFLGASLSFYPYFSFKILSSAENSQKNLYNK